MPRLGPSIFPSHMRTENRVRLHDGNLFSDSLLHLGEVQELIYPDDARSRSKKWVEYQVWVQFIGKNKTYVHRLYNNCLLINPLGSLADHFEFTLRAEKSATNPDNYHVGKGAKVLLLCLDDQTTQGVIIGGLRDQADTSDQNATKDDGINMYFVFNGIQAKIDKNGQLLLTYGGATQLDGTLTDNVDSKKVGTNLLFDKNGSWSVSSLDPDDNSQVDQSIILDNDNRQILIKPKNGLLIGEATDLMLLGESFRKAQQQMNTTLQSLLQSLQQTIIIAGSQLDAAGTALTASPAAGAAAGVTAAGAALTAAGPIIAQIKQAIADFEQAGAETNFLSSANKND